MAAKKEGKTAEQIQAEKAETTRLMVELEAMTNKVPASVMGGAYQVAVAWKSAAKKARSAISSANPRLASLKAAYQQLSVY